MEPSKAVCSSGVVIDLTPPEVNGVTLSGGFVTPSVICDTENTTIYALDHTGVLHTLISTDVCLLRCGNKSELSEIHRFPMATLDNGTLANPLTIEESDEFCHRYTLFKNDSPIYLPHENIHLSWGYLEPESQMLDYYIGISSTGHTIDEPDISGYMSSHNLTHFKCFRCGPGHGNEFYIHINALNKANLADHFIFGPIIIDITPPFVQCKLDVDVHDECVTLHWPKDCFADNEDYRLLTDYLWCLGMFLNLKHVIY